MTEMFSNIRFWMLVVVGPFLCLIPDFLFKYGPAIFFPAPSDIIMKEQKRNPNYLYMESFLKKDIRNYLSGVIKKNRSVGHLTSKVLNEINKDSDS
jgi:hypothetical protein